MLHPLQMRPRATRPITETFETFVWNKKIISFPLHIADASVKNEKEKGHHSALSSRCVQGPEKGWTTLGLIYAALTCILPEAIANALVQNEKEKGQHGTLSSCCVQVQGRVGPHWVLIMLPYLAFCKRLFHSLNMTSWTHGDNFYHRAKLPFFVWNENTTF